jgi:hypothetical protein
MKHPRNRVSTAVEDLLPLPEIDFDVPYDEFSFPPMYDRGIVIEEGEAFKARIRLCVVSERQDFLTWLHSQIEQRTHSSVTPHD